MRSYGVAIFDALPRRGTVSDVMLYAPLADRKKRIARLPAQARVGIVLSDHTDEDGIMLFLQACKLGLDPGKKLDEPVGPNFPLRYKPTPPARPSASILRSR